MLEFGPTLKLGSFEFLRLYNCTPTIYGLVKLLAEEANREAFQKDLSFYNHKIACF